MSRNLFYRPFAAACAFLTLVLCGCAAQRSLPPQVSASAQTQSALGAKPELPILLDTNPSTAGVFLGAVCDQTSVVSCPNFAAKFRHGIALGTAYSDWSVDIMHFLTNQGLAGWPALGITPEVTWQPTSTVTFADINSGKYDAFFTTTALELKQFGSTIFLRPFHEFNGWWYPWGLQNQGASSATDAAFIAAWRRMVGIFHQEGATNVKFVWCFSTGGLANTASWDNPANVYPGDTYVDWISFDSYNRGNLKTGVKWKSFDEIAQTAYQVAASISSTKPISMSELASTEYGDNGTMKADWIKTMLTELQSPSSPYPHLKLFSWFESDIKGYRYDLQSTSPVYNTFVSGVRSYDKNGVLYFRSNAAALDSLVSL